MKIPSQRCINIDWLEVHCIEPSEARDANYFRALGFDVSERDYGTRVYEQMFTLIDSNGQPFIEIRRQPHKTNNINKYQVMEPGSCHLRLSNRACYYDNAGSMMQEFITQHGYEFRRISRIDLALDFETFDSGDNPAKFVTRYLHGRYAKVNQCTIAVHGQDLWDGQQWNSISWGSKKSPVFTRFYNKTMELREVKDKPYIRQAWASCGLVSDFIQLTKKNERGEWYKPEIWRLEFAITSAVKNWVCFDVDDNGDKTHFSVRNDLSRYLTRDHLLTMFSSLVQRYFHFKLVQEKKAVSIALNTIREEVDWVHRHKDIQRKDRCPDKPLFAFGKDNQTYKVEKLVPAKVDNHALLLLKQRIELYKSTHIQTQMRQACDVILESIEKELLIHHAVNPHDETEIQLLQRLISYRISTNRENPLSIDKEFINSLLDLQDDIFF